MNPFRLLIEESRRYLETSLPMVRPRPTPTSGKTDTPQEGIDGSDREEGEDVIIGSGGGGGVERGGSGRGGDKFDQQIDVKGNVDLLVERSNLPVVQQQLNESLSSAKKTPSAENVQRLRDSLLATENSYVNAYASYLRLEDELGPSQGLKLMYIWGSVAKPFKNLESEVNNFLQKPTPKISSPISSPKKLQPPSISVDTKALKGLNGERMNDGGGDNVGGGESDSGGDDEGGGLIEYQISSPIPTLKTHSPKSSSSTKNEGSCDSCDGGSGNAVIDGGGGSGSGGDDFLDSHVSSLPPATKTYFP